MTKAQFEALLCLIENPVIEEAEKFLVSFPGTLQSKIDSFLGDDSNKETKLYKLLMEFAEEFYRLVDNFEESEKEAERIISLVVSNHTNLKDLIEMPPLKMTTVLSIIAKCNNSSKQQAIKLLAQKAGR